LLKPWLQARKIDIPAELVPFVLTIVLAAFAGLSIPVNLFSTQSLYQNRLVRCYLGASRPKIDFPLYGHEPQATDDPLEIRRGVPTHVNPDGTIAGAMVGTRVVEKFVDFDAADDLPLAALADPEYVGPYPIFNTMMSTAGTEDMAVADRRGESFFITPMRLGNPRLGFAKLPSIQSLESNGNQLTLGRAFSVSGAAADANNRTVPSGPLSILAGILNLRWGVWTRSPHPKAGAWDSENGAWPGGEPGAMWPYLEELSGSTRGTGKYVYLTDAGHFDNSGVYELIRRRCRFIVFLDAAEDVFAASENLANVIRLVRTDFGVRIDIDPATLTKGPDGISASHVAVGAIRYDDLGDGLGVGTFVFVRSSLTGDEPADLKNFALTNPPFPHDSSFRMAFSDERFESYRELGFHLGISTFAAAADELKRAESKIGKNARRHNRWLFSLVRNRWSNQPTDAYAKYSAAVAPWYQVENALRDRPCLKKANLGMYPELSQNLLGLEALDDCTLDEIHVFAELVEMMETSWMDMGLDEHAANPLHRGWMNCYRRWTATPQLHKYWPIFRPQYSAQFVRFCERALNLERPEVAVRASEDVPEPQRQAFVERLRAEFHGEWKWNLKGEGDGDATTKFGDPFAALGGKRVFFPVHPSPGAGTPWLPEYPLGIAIVGPKAEGPRTLFFYVRGGFRSANIGRRALRSLIEDTLEPDEMREEYVVRLPRLALTLNERSVEGRWIAFFNDFGFYPEKGVDAKAEIVLVRKPMGH
jgi:GNAT superfamily N-acetyltransferase